MNKKEIAANIIGSGLFLVTLTGSLLLTLIFLWIIMGVGEGRIDNPFIWRPLKIALASYAITTVIGYLLSRYDPRSTAIAKIMFSLSPVLGWMIWLLIKF